MVRAELRCWQEKANIIATQIQSRKPLVAIYFEAINGHYRFVTPNAKDKNKRRRKNVKWWQEYVQTEKKTILSIKRDKPTLKQSRGLDRKASLKNIS